MSGLGEGRLAYETPTLSTSPSMPFEDQHITNYNLDVWCCFESIEMDPDYIERYLEILKDTFLKIEQGTHAFVELGHNLLGNMELYAPQCWVRASTLSTLHARTCKILQQWSPKRIQECEHLEQRPFATNIHVHKQSVVLWQRIGECMKMHILQAHEEIESKIVNMDSHIENMLRKHITNTSPDITTELANVMENGEYRDRMLAVAQVYKNAKDRLLEWDFDMRKKHDRKLVAHRRTFRGRVRKYQYMCKRYKKLYMMTKYD